MVSPELLDIATLTEADCDALVATAEYLRAAVAYRFITGQADGLSACAGVPHAALAQFVETGEIAEGYRLLLEASR